MILDNLFTDIKNRVFVYFLLIVVNKLKKYGEENGVNPAKWHLLTGDKSIIYSLGRSSFFADNNKLTDSTTFLHTDKMYLIDKNQQIRGVYNATNMDDISRVLTDIKALK
jgi:protein SCO1/2